jgi:gliding motility-associated-like protein
MVNDLFIIGGLAENSTLLIFDRSGKKLYESANYQNNWDGREQPGKMLVLERYW